jgi:hypothetical protein
MRPPALLRSWPALAFAWVAASGLLAFWILRTSPAELRDQLRHLQFWPLELTFLALIATTSLTLPHLFRNLGVQARHYVAGAVIAVATFVLVLAVAPRTNRIFYDEQIYQGIGQNLAELRLAQMCNDGTVEYGTLQCWRGEYNKEPYGFAYLIAFAYRLAGTSEAAAALVNPLLTALTVWVVFLLTTSLTGKAGAGLCAAVIGMCMPQQLKWAHTTAAEPAAAFGSVLAILAAFTFARTRSSPALAWMVVSVAFAAQLRAEGLLVAGVAAVVVLLFAPAEFRTRRFWWSALAGFMLLFVHAAHLFAVRQESWGTGGPRFSTEFLLPNLTVNGGFFLGDPRFPILYTVLAIAGVALSPWRRAVAGLLLYFVSFWGIFLFFYAGSYNYGADDRFAVLALPPVMVLAGLGLWKMVERFSTWKRVGESTALTAALAFIVIHFTIFLPSVRATGEEAWGARADVSFARAVAAGLPANSYVFTHNPNMFHVWGRNAGQSSLAALESNYVNDVLIPRYAGGLFFHWNFWCNVADAVQQSFCAGILEKYPHTLVHEYRERNYRYALYRLDVVAPARPGVR